jgi:DnaJ like chaperone protein
MDIVTVIIVIAAGIFLYALFSGRKRSTGQGHTPEGNQPPPPGTGSPFSRKSRGYGKWIGGGLGWAFGGPIGAILGFALGSMFEGMNSEKYAYRGTPRGDFAMSLLVLSAAVMKADQKVVRSELDYVRDFFIRQFGDSEGVRMITMLREILKQDINIPGVSSQVGNYMDYPSRLQLLHFLFGIAAADGHYHPEEVEVIRVISGHMGISSADYLSVHAMFVKDPGWAYDVLEITRSASDQEVKKAFREMAKKHHPDKVSHLGDDIRKAATGKFQKINAAYEEIKRQRGLT